MYKREINRIQKAHSNYLIAIGALEKKLMHKILFRFAIDDMPGDGFVVLNDETSDVAPLDSCIRIIQKEGKLTTEMHKELCI